MDKTHRILDANLNRAREGLRTAEEYARLYLDDAEAAQMLKDVRRYLQVISDGLGAMWMLSRDIDNDVGTRPEADDVRRRTPLAVAIAGIKRTQEALRVIEEYGQLDQDKMIAPMAAKARYSVYAVEQRLFSKGPKLKILRDSPVMVIFAREACKQEWEKTLESLIDGGARLFQIREKEATARDLACFAEDFMGRVPRHETCVLINDRADVALRVNADGVHLGQDDLDIDTARKILGPASIIGQSTHNAQEAKIAEQSGADYVGLGAMFHTGTKKVQSQGGPEMIPQVLEAVTIPVFCIGGINRGNLGELVGHGARHIAVSSALLNAPDPGDAYRALVEALGEQA